MEKKKARQKHFAHRELRFSIAHLVLWALLTVAFFTYVAIEIGGKIERGPLYFAIVVLGYALIVIVLTLVFTHRFLGPFERLKTELRLIRTGDRNRRFHVRNKDDYYLRSFISEINKVLEDYEKVHISREELGKKMASEISDIRSSIESGESNKEALLKAVISLQEKSKDLLKDPKRH